MYINLYIPIDLWNKANNYCIPSKRGLFIFNYFAARNTHKTIWVHAYISRLPQYLTGKNYVLRFPLYSFGFYRSVDR